MPQTRKTKLAIFDIDGTIFRSSLLIELVNQFVEEGIFPKTTLAKVEAEYQQWLDRKGSYEDYIRKVVVVYLANIKGKKRTDMVRVARKVIRQQSQHLYRFTRKLTQDLRKQGYYLVAISGSPDEIVREFATTMKFDAAFGTLLRVEDGVYTGEAELDNTVRDKSLVVRLFLEDFQINADLRQSVAVGDTEGDIPMLSLVGKPIAFNPNQNLLRVARRRGWRIVVERKDTILDLKDFKQVRS